MKTADLFVVALMVGACWALYRVWKQQSGPRTFYAGFNDPLPDLLANGQERPPAGASWDEMQGAFVMRDSAGRVVGLYT